ncbi:MAG: acyltransferase [Pyrinomonadaceae bacterium]
MQSIDALRGIAALGVVVYHVVGVNPRFDMKNPLARVVEVAMLNAFSYGYIGVFLFFVISGFCIHLQHAKAQAANASPEINFKAFWKRRLWRLYPPYLIALVLYLLPIVLARKFEFTLFFFWDVVSHLLMLHNLDTRTVYSINGVFWTLAIEEQLYLAYFLLLFIRKRFGWSGALVMCLAARVGWFLLIRFLWYTFQLASPIPESAAVHWFTWALGAIAVEAFFGVVKLPVWCRKFRVGIAFIVVAIGLTVAQEHIGGFIHDVMWLLLHPMWGLGFFVILNCAVHREAIRREKLRTPRGVTMLAAIGVFSYSLYLAHQLVIMGVYKAYFVFIPFYYLHLPQKGVELLVVTPLCVAGAWIFFRLFERPFLSRKATIESDETLTTARTVVQDVA